MGAALAVVRRLFRRWILPGWLGTWSKLRGLRIGMNDTKKVTTPRQNDAPVEITFTTRYLNRGFEIDVPGCIQAVAKGTEANVNSAAESFSSFANLKRL